jgi:hypothetical protein
MVHDGSMRVTDPRQRALGIAILAAVAFIVLVLDLTIMAGWTAFGINRGVQHKAAACVTAVCNQ